MLWRMSERTGYSVWTGVRGNHLFKRSLARFYPVRMRVTKSAKLLACPDGMFTVSGQELQGVTNS